MNGISIRYKGIVWKITSEGIVGIVTAWHPALYLHCPPLLLCAILEASFMGPSSTQVVKRSRPV